CPGLRLGDQGFSPRSAHGHRARRDGVREADPVRDRRPPDERLRSELSEHRARKLAGPSAARHLESARGRVGEQAEAPERTGVRGLTNEIGETGDRAHVEPEDEAYAVRAPVPTGAATRLAQGAHVTAHVL